MVAAVGTRRAFDALSRTRVRGSCGPVWVARADPADAGIPSHEAHEPRVAYAVGARIGNAVVRNRVRRRLRAVMAELEADGTLAPGVYLVGVRPDVVGVDFDRLRTALRTAVPDASRAPR